MYGVCSELRYKVMQATVRRGPHQESDQILALGVNQFSVLVRQFSDSIADDFEFQPVYLSAVAQILFVVIRGIRRIGTKWSMAMRICPSGGGSNTRV